MIVYAWPLFDPTSAPSASPRTPSTASWKSKYKIDTLYTNFDFSFQILHQSKGIRVNVFLGLWCLVRIFGFMKRTISTSAYVMSLITSNHFYHCSLLDSEIRIRIVIHRVYICSVVLLHYCYHSESCRVTNPTELNWRCQVSSLPATCRSFIGYHVVPPRSAVF